MKDTRLWLLLAEQNRKPEQLLPLLAQLSERSLLDRFPFFGALRDLHRSDDARLRKAVLRVLAGATGHDSLKQIVAALDDEDSEIRAIAVNALATSSLQHDPAKMAHAVFHAQEDVRRAALDRLVGTNIAWYGLYLVCDDAHGSRALDVAKGATLDLAAVAAVLELHDNRRLSTELVAALLVNLPPSGFHGSTQPERTPGVIETALAEIDSAAVGGSLRDVLVPGHDLLDELIDVFWDDELQSSQHRMSEWLDKFRDLEATAEHSLAVHLTDRVTVSIVQVANRRGSWISPALEWCIERGSLQITGCADIPRDLRRNAISALYKARLHKLSDSDPVFPWLLQSDITRREDGHLDLWAIGGILQCARDYAYKILLDRFTVDQIVEAFLTDPVDSAALFTLAEMKGNRRQDLIAAIRSRSECEDGFLLAILVHSVNADGYDFLKKLDSEDTLAVLGQLFRLGQRPEWSLSERKLRAAGFIMAWRLARALHDFLVLWLNQLYPNEYALGLEILTTLVRELPAEEFLEHVRSLPDDLVWKLLQAIPYCPGFPYGHEKALSLNLKDRTHPDVADWCAARLPTSLDPLPAITRHTNDTLTPEELRRIRAVTDADLSSALETALERPRAGVAEALSRRATPTVPQLDACCALLGCMDPLEEVDAEFVRFAGTDPDADFLAKLDRQAVACWERNGDLGLLGHVWLWCWERHTFAFGKDAARDESNLCKVLTQSISLKSAILRLQFWKATERLCKIWRARERDRFREVVGEELLQLAIDALATDVGLTAATIAMLYLGDPDNRSQLEPHRAAVAQILPDLPPPVRRVLEPWVSSRGLSSRTTTRPQRNRLPSGTRQEISRSVDLDVLAAWCRSSDGGVVTEAALRLLELEEAGQSRLAGLLATMQSLPCFALLAETIPMWETGDALDWLRNFAIKGTLDAQGRFFLGLAFLERGDLDFADLTLQATLDENSWFRASDWSRLTQTDVPIGDIVQVLAKSPQPHAYCAAVEHCLGCRDDNLNACDALRGFLDCGTRRLKSLRLAAATWLMRTGDDLGVAVILCSMSDADYACLEHITYETGKKVVDAVFYAGDSVFPHRQLKKILDLSLLDSRVQEYGYQRLAFESVDNMVIQAVLPQLKWTDGRRQKLRQTARVFHAGKQTAQQLTGRLFNIEMIAGTDLGWTRLQESKLFINPIAIMEGSRHGEDVVHGLIVHEIGHHLYHSGQAAEIVWEQAERDGLGALLNLVADEHLERNLRALSKDYGNQFKRLGAYAFQHSRKEIRVSDLLSVLKSRAFEILSRSRLRVARTPTCVRLNAGRVLSEAERCGMSFPRFFRALRMGLGDRFGDPKVQEALRLFRKSFRHASMEDLLGIARKLRDIFSDEAQLLVAMNQDFLEGSTEAELRQAAEGITNEQMQADIRRVERSEDLPQTSSAGDKRGFGRWINLLPDIEFEPIHDVVPMPYDRAAHHDYAQRVRPHAVRLRRFLIDLGIQYEPAPRRLRGSRVSRQRLNKLVLNRDPRILISRERHQVTDLFLGVVVDCSGSMNYADHMERAKRFAMLVAEAAESVSGIDVRIFGFDDSVIFDAGTAARPCVSELTAGGGNNDAAALWHAARMAIASRRKAKLLVMISDGLPTECSVAALRALVVRLTNRYTICCAQAAVQPLEEINFPHYVVLDQDLERSVQEFGLLISRLVRRAMSA